jgi:hypothetical protein
MSKLFPIAYPLFLYDAERVREAGIELTQVIPWEMISLHEQQVRANHRQRPEQLAERGGLTACEALAVLEDRKGRWIPLEQAYERLNQLVRAHRATDDAITPGSGQ